MYLAIASNCVCGLNSPPQVTFFFSAGLRFLAFLRPPSGDETLAAPHRSTQQCGRWRRLQESTKALNRAAAHAQTGHLRTGSTWSETVPNKQRSLMSEKQMEAKSSAVRLQSSQQHAQSVSQIPVDNALLGSTQRAHAPLKPQAVGQASTKCAAERMMVS